MEYVRLRNDGGTRFIDGARVRPGQVFTTCDPSFVDDEKRPDGIEVIERFTETEASAQDVKAKTKATLATRRKKVKDGDPPANNPGAADRIEKSGQPTL
jgi:hypothetical protein